MKRLLIVDDDYGILSSLQMFFEERYVVEAASSGGEAVEALGRLPIDAMVLDLMMPVMDGAAVVRYLEASGKRVPVVIVSAGGDVAAQARALGVKHYIRKPFDIDVLAAMIETAMAKA